MAVVQLRQAMTLTPQGANPMMTWGLLDELAKKYGYAMQIAWKSATEDGDHRTRYTCLLISFIISYFVI